MRVTHVAGVALVLLAAAAEAFSPAFRHAMFTTKQQLPTAQCSRFALRSAGGALSLSMAAPRAGDPCPAGWQAGAEVIYGASTFEEGELVVADGTFYQVVRQIPFPPWSKSWELTDGTSVVQVAAAKIGRATPEALDALAKRPEPSSGTSIFGGGTTGFFSGLFGSGDGGAAGAGAGAPGKLVNKKIPAGWREGTDFARASGLRVGDVVIVSRSDGSLRFAEVLGSAGGGLWDLVVELAPDGVPLNNKRQPIDMIYSPKTLPGAQPPP
eukprot:CAMPEP_0172060996 /NCGR_PEP_ID=MMETSP1043-20130122/8254_1 /TAXON_ID=464988 /ORGANISM="Hemiselmis andersenii, Strain CCMP441" /LENGTH=267 /DNA_ID=CAMNT_0012720783 /DNA_START=166 /DNA_END=965 /DNA_ORIENTATION=+